MGPFAVAMVVPIATLVFVGLIVWLALQGKQARLRTQAEFQKSLLDKFSSGQEFAGFLESSGGQKFLEQLWSPLASDRRQLLKNISIGVVFSALGLGLFALAFFVHGQRGIIIPAVVFLALGVGFLISAVITNRLLKQWGESAQSDSLRA